MTGESTVHAVIPLEAVSVAITHDDATCWLVDLRIEPTFAQLACLSDAERRQASRFVFERDRRRYLTAHVRLRQLLAARVFCEAERRELDATEPSIRSLAFLRGWTRKEACLKALGSGLGIAPESVEVGLGVQAITTSISVGQRRARVEVRSAMLRRDLVCAIGRVVDSGPVAAGACAKSPAQVSTRLNRRGFVPVRVTNRHTD